MFLVIRSYRVLCSCLYILHVYKVVVQEMTSTGAAVHRYQIGELFVHMSEEETQEVLEQAKERLQEELTKLKTSAESIEGVMSTLKLKLYSKFGDSINLEAD